MKKIKVGDIVTWKCKPYHGSWFIAKGEVQKIGESTFGAWKTGVALQIKTGEEYRKVFPNRSTTTISLDNVIDIFRLQKI